MTMPIVKAETCFALEQECKNLTDKELVQILFKKLKKCNPIVATWIKAWSKHTKDHVGAMACALIAYRMLESQSQADYMNEIFDV
jgi:hypothetical protein